MMRTSKLQRSVFRRASRWFDRARAAVFNEIPCGKGCCLCCIGPFAITTLDHEEIQRGLETMGPAQRASIQTHARNQVADLEASYHRLTASPLIDDWPDSEVDRLVEQFSDVACPALQEDGSCGVYPFRPLACRTMGIPTEVAGTVEGACEVQLTVPIRRLPAILRQGEERLAEDEAAELDRYHRDNHTSGDEILLPYGFLSIETTVLSPANDKAVSSAPSFNQQTELDTP
ncbi:MAG: YkgJ family cysteine cluster protein [Nitrospiraceae bacterium]